MGGSVSQEDARYAAIIVAAGTGARSGQAMPKQFVGVAGKPMLRWSVETFAADSRCDAVIIVIGEGQEDAARTALEDLSAVTFVTGGATRQMSVRNGLAALEALANHPDLVLIHDAARPFVPEAVLDRLLAALADNAGAVPVLAVADTMAATEGKHLGDIVPRDTLRRIQTPQAFHLSAILAAHQAAPDDFASDDAQLLRLHGSTVALVEGANDLNKFTYAEEFAMAGHRPPPPLTRIAVGMGYDVHRLVPDKPLWLGGIEIAHSHGLSGHSDADAALHALTDAILGALAEGDIGQHFPPSDPQWKGASSDRFLDFAGARVRERGGDIHSVDLTIICEAPKIGPHRAAMQLRIAEILQLSPDRISVKATTTEGLGFAGRREGIAVQAVVSIALSLT